MEASRQAIAAISSYYVQTPDNGSACVEPPLNPAPCETETALTSPKSVEVSPIVERTSTGPQSEEMARGPQLAYALAQVLHTDVLAWSRVELVLLGPGCSGR